MTLGLVYLEVWLRRAWAYAVDCWERWFVIPAPSGLRSAADADAFVAALRTAVANEAHDLAALPLPVLAPPPYPTPVTPLLHHLDVESIPRPPRLRATPLALPARVLEPAQPVPAHVEGWPVGGRIPVRREIALPPRRSETTPIFDAMVAEMAARNRALTSDTQEIRAIFAEITSPLAREWVCEHCAEDVHSRCPGCPCPQCTEVLVGGVS